MDKVQSMQYDGLENVVNLMNLFMVHFVTESISYFDQKGRNIANIFLKIINIHTSALSIIIKYEKFLNKEHVCFNILCILYEK